jgi:hypothetical protein
MIENWSRHAFTYRRLALNCIRRYNLEEMDKVLTASASPQQLISVGDQQLQAGCTVRALEAPPYLMDTSMFERLVKNFMRYVMLNKRRRMVRCS